MRNYYKEYYLKNKEKVNLKNKDYYLKNLDKMKVYNKEWWGYWYSKNKQKYLEHKRTWGKLYRSENKEKIRQRKREYKNKRLKEDMLFKLDYRISNAIYIALRKEGFGKKGSWQSFLGYSTEDLKEWLEKQFIYDKNMSWNNYGSYWVIDHIKPKSWFYNEELDYGKAVKKAWALENLQPFPRTLNSEKSNKNCLRLAEATFVL